VTYLTPFITWYEVEIPLPGLDISQIEDIPCTGNGFFCSYGDLDGGSQVNLYYKADLTAQLGLRSSGDGRGGVHNFDDKIHDYEEEPDDY
jgi:hypothetical protein